MTLRSSGVVATALAATFAIATSSAGCDKLRGGSADGGAAASGGGGLFSFLDKSFEGEVTMNVSGKDLAGGANNAAAAKQPKSLLFGLKTPKVRVDAGADIAQGNPMLAQGAAFIIDPPAKKAYALLIAQKKAIVLDLDKSHGGLKLPRAPGSPAAPSGPPSDPPKIEKTGKKEVVAGFQCEVWKITSKTGHADACLAEGIKWIDLADIGVQSPEFAAVAAVSDFNHFPLRFVAFDAQNVETSRMEATKIEKKKLDDARFVVPPDFQVIDMSAMLGNLQGLGAAGGRPGLPPGLPPGFVPPPKK